MGSLAAVAFDVVIAGGGFGGLYAARRLERRLPRHSARITVVSDLNFLLYTPLLPGAAAGTLEPRHVVVPIREELEWAELELGRVTGADPAVNEVYVRTLDERDETLRYDQLVIALGSVSRVLPIPGLAEHAIGFKTLADAIGVRNRALLNLEIAESLPDDASRREYLTFVFVGAGYAGVEGIAELQDYVSDILDDYPRCRAVGTRWVLVEALDQIMPEVSKGLAEFATRELRGRGIEVRAGTRFEGMDDRTVTLSTGERIHTHTVVWTAGVKPGAIVKHLGVPLTKGGRIDVDATMRVRGLHNVWAIGDAAAVPDPAKGRKQPTPPTCQHAIRQGRVVGENVAASLAGRKTRPFRYRTLGVFVDMGRNKAVASILGIPLRGFPAWFAARTYHLAMMPGFARRVRLGADWAVGLLFGRASAELGQLGHPPALRDYLDEEATPPAEDPGQRTADA
jgi:NADH dehydrogenase